MDVIEPGGQVGKYPITRLIGVGGMGMVYEAVHPVFGSPVVIKTIRPELAHDRGIIDRFFREALAMGRVRDERLPRIFDQARLADGTPYIVMELLEGDDLAQRLARGPLPVPRAARVMVEVLEVLDKAHRVGIVHRDVKPQNIFLARSDLWGEVPKLLDFGVAHFESEGATRPGEVMGSPLYMALEQSEPGLRVGPWTDVFAAGVVLYEAIAGAGRRPWGPQSPLGYLSLLKAGAAPRPLTDAAVEVPQGLWEAVARALRSKPSERWPDALSFARALEPFAAPRLAGASTLAPHAAPPAPGLPRATSLGTQDTLIERRAERRVPVEAARCLRARLGVGAVAGGERRLVVLVAARVSLRPSPGFLLEPALGDEVSEALLPSLAQALEAAGAHVEPLVGRSVVAAFGWRRAEEDDVARALSVVRVLLCRQREADVALAEHGCGVSVGVGLHVGFLSRHGEGRLLGEAVEVARALAVRAPENGVLVSRASRESLPDDLAMRGAPAVPLAGQSPVPALELMVGLDRGSRRWTRPGVGRHFVGRVEALAALESLLAAHEEQGGRPHVAWIFGPAGIGKSRLMSAFVERVSATRSTAVTVVRPEPERAYGLWGALLRSLLFTGDGRAAGPGELSGGLAVLAEALEEPSARDSLRGARAPAALLLGMEGAPSAAVAPELGRAQVLRLVSLAISAGALNAARSTGHPLLLVFDELHRADAASLELLPRVVAAVRVPRAPLMLLATRADEVLPEADAVADARLLLAPLPSAEVDALVDAVAPPGASSSPAARALIRGRAGGNPLFVEALVEALSQRSLLDAGAEALAEVDPPASLFALLLARVGRLPSDLQAALRRLAVCGVEVERVLWEALADRLGEPLDTANDQLDRLVRVGLLDAVEVGGAPGYRFRQPLLRDALYHTVLPDALRRTHHHVALALAERFPGASAARRLAHLRQTDAEAEVPQLAALVGRQHLAVGALEEALAALRLAASLHARMDADPEEEAEVLADLAGALFYLGRFGEAGEAAAEALKEDRAVPPVLAARVQRVLADVAYYRADWEAARAALRETRRLYTEAGDRLGAAVAQCNEGFVLRSMGRITEGLELARAGWAVLRAAGEPPGLVRAGHDLGNVLRSAGAYEEALEVLAVAVEVGSRRVAAGQASLGRWVGAAESGRALVHEALGDLAAAEAGQRRVFDFARRLGNRVAQVVGGAHLMRVVAARGRLGEALTLGEEALAVAAEVGMPHRAMRLRLQLGQLRLELGDTRGAVEHLEAAEFLARDGEASVEEWLGVVEVLVAALGGVGAQDRQRALVRAARERVGQAGGGRLLARVESLADAAAAV